MISVFAAAMPPITFEATVTLGVVVHLLGLIITGFYFFTRMERRLDRRFSEQDKCLHRLHGENKARLDVLESRVSDLWRWMWREEVSKGREPQ